MKLRMTSPQLEIPPKIIDAIRSFPLVREVEHCGHKFLAASPFDIYAICPHCSARIKIRSFSAGDEIEDVFDAFFEWLNRPGADAIARRRQETIEDDSSS